MRLFMAILITVGIIMMGLSLFIPKQVKGQDLQLMTDETGRAIVHQLEKQNDTLKEILEQAARIKDRMCPCK